MGAAFTAPASSTDTHGRLAPKGPPSGAVFRSLPALPPRVFAALAITLPCVGFAIHHGWGHEGDLRFFHAWVDAFLEGPTFYRDGPGVNYPILGALLVAGPSSLGAGGGPLPFETFRAVHKTVLVAAEVGLVLASARLAMALGSSRPRWLAVGLYLLPSTWAGGAWFGQTDVVGTLALVVAADGLVRYRADGQGRTLAQGLLALHAAFLLKQLTWFALPPLTVLLLGGLHASRHRTHLAATLMSLGLWFVADPWLVLPDGHVSHLAFVIARSTGDHGSLLVANGASVWLLARSSGLAATDPWLGSVTPGQVGWGVWATLAIVWTSLAIRARDALAFVRAAGVTSLAMALFLTGVHERYLVHAVPLLLLTTRGTARGGVVVLGVVSGGYVLSSVHSELAWLGRPEPVLFVSFLCLGLMAVAEWEMMKRDRTRK